MAPKYRADHVGSLLRPPGVVEAHLAHAEGKLSLGELRAIEDAAVLRVLEMQKEVGIDVATDGEYRRVNWSTDFEDAMDRGYVEGRPAVEVHFQTGGVSGLPGRVLGEPLHQTRRLTEHESTFLKRHAPGAWKVTMPAPSYIVARGYSLEVSDRAFGSRVGLLKAVSAVINAEVRALVAEGCKYLQLDNSHYTDFLMDERRAQWKAAGVDPDQALREDVAADNAALAGIDRSAVVVGAHICRGNGRGPGGWHAIGGYDRIAETVFGGLEVDRFLLEYDSDRAGTFSPLRHLPKGKTAVLGLITTRVPALEDSAVLRQRIEEASKYVAPEDLALSPQCGFASVMYGHPLTWEEQTRKLDLVVQTARKVWNS